MPLLFYNENYLSKDNTNALKGLLAIVVFVCHLPSYLGLFSDQLAGSLLVCFGSPAVGLYFFLSGYGVTISFKNREGYLKGFWRRRILPFSINYLFVLCLYVLLNIAVGKHIDGNMLLKSFVLGGYVLNGWYIQIQFWLYVTFFFVYSLRLNTRWKNSIVLITLVAYYAFGVAIKIQGTYYISVLLFWLGLVWAENNETINRCLDEHKVAGLPIGIGMTGIGVLLIVIRSFTTSFFFGRMVTTLSDMMFCIGTLIFIRYFPVRCLLTDQLGIYSFEIYVL